jgi:hypothetical protein
MTTTIVNPFRAAVEITLEDGIKRQLQYDANAVVALSQLLEEKLNATMRDVKNLINGRMHERILVLQIFLYAGVVCRYQGDKTLTFEQIGALMPIDNLEKLNRQLFAAYAQAQPDRGSVKNVGAAAGRRSGTGKRRKR